MLLYLWKAKEDISEDNFDFVLMKTFCDHNPKKA